jgi:hypothetical protein
LPDEITELIPPKTDWLSSDRFNIEDYNRIRNNILYIHGIANQVYPSFELESMGESKNSYDGYWTANEFNAIESNVSAINDHILSKDYGVPQRFFPNGAFIKWDELNRIESAISSMNAILARQKGSIPRLQFRLGNYKSIKI